jgi:hypothetical protein
MYSERSNRSQNFLTWRQLVQIIQAQTKSAEEFAQAFGIVGGFFLQAGFVEEEAAGFGERADCPKRSLS